MNYVDVKKADKKNISNKKKIIRVVLIFCVIFYLIVNGLSGGKGKRVDISNTSEAYELVQEFYPLTEYRVSPNQVSTCPKAVFDGKVGKAVNQDAWSENEQVEVYAFGVSSGDFIKQGQVWVSSEGGVIQMGLDGNGKFYLIR